MVATYWGDGVIFSTAAGSTAYSLSAGGPVVAPGCECFVLSPIAPHNLTMRPVVVPDDSAVSFRIRSRGEECFVTLDSSSWKVPDGSRFEAGRAKNSVFLVKLQNISFYDTLRNKMMWGFDRRDQNNT
jgi:NAD+ kinase